MRKHRYQKQFPMAIITYLAQAALLIALAEAPSRANEPDIRVRYEKSADILTSKMEHLERWLKTPLPQIVIGLGGTRVYKGCKSSEGDNRLFGSYFCSKTNTIIMEAYQLMYLSKKYGTASVPYVMAHELGHWIQDHTSEITAAQKAGPDFELAADCIAGMLLGPNAEGARWDLNLTNQDIRRIEETAFGIGDDGTSHGTPEQRKNAFIWGYSQGRFASCLNRKQNDYNKLDISNGVLITGNEKLSKFIFVGSIKSDLSSPHIKFFTLRSFKSVGTATQYSYAIKGPEYSVGVTADCSQKQIFLTDKGQTSGSLDIHPGTVGSKVFRFVCAR